MKTITLIFSLTLGLFSFAQTNVIANKSHSGDLAELNLEKDNFGIPGPTIDSLLYLSDSCLIIVSTEWGGGYTYHDTTCNSYYSQYINDPKELKQMFGSNVKLIGFKKNHKIKQIDQSTRQNGINWFFGTIILSFLIYVSFPSLIKKIGK